MSVTAAKGFEAAGVAAGLKSSGGLDLALVVNRGPRSNAAAVFTRNRAQANPIIWSRRVIADGIARSRSADDTSASVVMTTSIVARPGASIPAPLAMPPITQPSPSRRESFGLESVVMIARLTSSPC